MALYVDDRFHLSDEFAAAGPAAMGVWLGLGLDSALRRTDAYVSQAALSRVAGGDGRNPGRHSARLVAAGLWVPDEQRGGFHFAPEFWWNKTAAEQEADRFGSRTRKARSRARLHAVPDPEPLDFEAPGDDQ